MISAPNLRDLRKKEHKEIFPADLADHAEKKSIISTNLCAKSARSAGKKTSVNNFPQITQMKAQINSQI